MLIFNWRGFGSAARRAFEVRLCMLDIKMNFKNKYKSDLICKICKEDEETLYCSTFSDAEYIKIS